MAARSLTASCRQSTDCGAAGVVLLEPGMYIRGCCIMQTFCISTLGCKVNQYESEQIASLLRSRGLRQVDHADGADLRIINTCSVTIQAASKSRQAVRQTVRLPVLT